MARPVRVAAFTDLNQAKSRSLKDNLDWTCALLDQMACERPDIVCLTENFDSRETGLNHEQMAQCLDEPTFTRMAQKAQELRCYIVCAFIEKRAEGLFNTAALIDRNGALAGHYDKIHPTNGEIEGRILPGATAPSVILTDFGKIGCQICFDANWPEDWRALKDAGAEIIFFASAFSGGRIIDALATTYHLPIVAACYPQCCRIIDRDGLVLNRQGVYQKWVSAVLDLDNPLFHLDYQFDKVEAVRKEYGPDVFVKVYEEEGWWRVFPRRSDLDILEIIKRFQLERLEDYLARSTQVQVQARLESSS